MGCYNSASPSLPVLLNLCFGKSAMSSKKKTLAELESGHEDEKIDKSLIVSSSVVLTEEEKAAAIEAKIEAKKALLVKDPVTEVNDTTIAFVAPNMNEVLDLTDKSDPDYMQLITKELKEEKYDDIPGFEKIRKGWKVLSDTFYSIKGHGDDFNAFLKKFNKMRNRSKKGDFSILDAINLGVPWLMPFHHAMSPIEDGGCLKVGRLQFYYHDECGKFIKTGERIRQITIPAATIIKNFRLDPSKRMCIVPHVIKEVKRNVYLNNGAWDSFICTKPFDTATKHGITVWSNNPRACSAANIPASYPLDEIHHLTGPRCHSKDCGEILFTRAEEINEPGHVQWQGFPFHDFLNKLNTSELVKTLEQIKGPRSKSFEREGDHELDQLLQTDAEKKWTFYGVAVSGDTHTNDLIPSPDNPDFMFTFFMNYIDLIQKATRELYPGPKYEHIKGYLFFKPKGLKGLADHKVDADYAKMPDIYILKPAFDKVFKELKEKYHTDRFGMDIRSGISLQVVPLDGPGKYSSIAARSFEQKPETYLLEVDVLYHLVELVDISKNTTHIPSLAHAWTNAGLELNEVDLLRKKIADLESKAEAKAEEKRKRKGATKKKTSSSQDQDTGLTPEEYAKLVEKENGARGAKFNRVEEEAKYRRNYDSSRFADIPT